MVLRPRHAQPRAVAAGGDLRRAAQTVGCSTAVLFRHSAEPALAVLVLATLEVATMISTRHAELPRAGIQPPQSSWGLMWAGRSYVTTAWGLVTFRG